MKYSMVCALLLLGCAWRVLAQSVLEPLPPQKDPTQMTGSFNQALSRITGKPGQGASPLALPSVHLLARAIKRGGRAAMLKIDKETHMMKQGAKQSVVVNNQTYEIQLDEIGDEFVRITILPNGKTLTLQ